MRELVVTPRMMKSKDYWKGAKLEQVGSIRLLRIALKN
jgi:hypothetical protein